MPTPSLSLPLLVALLGLGACSTLTALGIAERSGLGRVDELLTHVERVHVEALVTKDRAEAALDGLRRLSAPELRGDPAGAHAELVAEVEQSRRQADVLRASVKPLRKCGEALFEAWTADLESIGNLALRLCSQERLEETRRRHDAVLAAAVAAQLACDAFHGDLADQALFLGHDFNDATLALVRAELAGLEGRAKELARRLDACAAACQAYVEFSAPSAELAPERGQGGGADPATTGAPRAGDPRSSVPHAPGG